MTTVIPDGVYFLAPDGSAWVSAIYRGGVYRGGSEEANQATHDAANDRYAGLCPSEDDDCVPVAIQAVIAAERNDCT